MVVSRRMNRSYRNRQVWAKQTTRGARETERRRLNLRALRRREGADRRFVTRRRCDRLGDVRFDTLLRLFRCALGFSAAGRRRVVRFTNWRAGGEAASVSSSSSSPPRILESFAGSIGAVSDRMTGTSRRCTLGVGTGGTAGDSAETVVGAAASVSAKKETGSGTRGVSIPADVCGAFATSRADERRLMIVTGGKSALAASWRSSAAATVSPAEGTSASGATGPGAGEISTTGFRLSRWLVDEKRRLGATPLAVGLAAIAEAGVSMSLTFAGFATG